MSYQTPKESFIPPPVKDNQENTAPNQASSFQGCTHGQVVGTPSNWTFLSQRNADNSVAGSQRSFGWVAKLADSETPERNSRHGTAHERLLQILQESGQKTVTIPDVSKVQQQSFQRRSAQENVHDIIMPIRQPIQPESAHPLSYGAFEPSPEIIASDKYYWPMTSIHGMHGTPFEAMCVAEPAAIHLGHSESKYSKPMLVSDTSTPLLAAKNSARADEHDAAEKVSLGFSPEYHGDPYLARNQSANIPDSLNCSLFLVNLPADLTTHRLIAAIHAMGPTGRIYATHINAPEPDRKHYGCAAKVIFFELKAAKAFYRACEERGFDVDGHNVRVMWNRIKTGQQEHARSTTRVLLIGGRPGFVNPTTLTEYFCTKLQFQIDCIITHSDGLRKGDNRDAVIEYRFGSFRCQAEAAKMALVREHPDVRCFFHCDPCDPEHWAPSEPIPVVRATRPAIPVIPPCLPRGGPGSQTWAGLPVVHENVKEQRVFRPMGAALGPWQT